MSGSGVFDRALRVAIFALLAAMLEFRSLIQAKIIDPMEKEIYIKTGDKLSLVCHEGEGDPLRSGPTSDGEPAYDQHPRRPAPQSHQSRLVWSRQRSGDPSYNTIELSSSSGFYTISAHFGPHDKEETTLLNDNVLLSDSASYRCQTNGTPSDYVKVKVIEVIARGATVEKINDEVRLDCSARDESSVKLNVSWFRDGHRIENKVKKYSLDVENGTVTIHRAGEKDIGLHTCVVSLPNGKTLSTDANIFAYPFVKSFDKSVNLREGSELMLRCLAWGWPSPQITWYRNDVIFNRSSDVRLSFPNDTIVPLHHAVLSLHALTLEDYAFYTCSATSSMWTGVASNSTILVRVKSRLAALWPFLGICVEIVILSVIIFIYEKQRIKKKEQEEAKFDGGKHLANCTTSGNEDNVRHRK